MTISKETWLRYVNKLAEVNAKASQLMIQYVQKHGFSDTEELIATAFNLADYYGEAAAAAACDLYDAIAAAEGVIVPPAVPAQPATYGEVAKAVQGTMKKTPNQVPQTVGRLVKQTGADTMLQNAQRDGAQFAWVPHGDTCAFCMTLASRGWQYMSKKTLKNGHAEHIHANCNCEYCVRFDGKSEVEGYDPDEYKRMYDEAEGSTPQEKINSIRREMYAENRSRELTVRDSNDILQSGAVSGALDPESERAYEHAERYYESVRHMTTDIKRIAENTGFSEEEIRAIKKYVFLEKHDLGETEPAYFYPSYRMAESWQRLIDGKDIQPHDITLLNHEIMERNLTKTGLSQEEAHRITERVYNYKEEAQAFYDKINRNKKR